MNEAGVDAPALSVHTVALDTVEPLIPLLDERDPLLFIRRGDGIAGVGEALRLEFTGATRFQDAAAAWRRVVAAATIDDEVRLPGTGLVALGSFAFSEHSTATSVLIVPRVVVGRREGRAWITRVGDGGTRPVPRPFGAEYRTPLLPGAMSGDAYVDAVGHALDAIRSGRVRKVVLARDLLGHLPVEADLRRVLAELALGYPDTYTFAVNGLIGSSPETLVRVNHGSVSARVLAGSIGRGTDAEADQAAAIELATSAKDLDEHAFALASLVSTLTPHTSALTASDQPFTLKLPNLWHLASDIEGTLEDASSSLDLIGGLHPTAAVAGTPTDAALEIIRELEQFDRGRYAGPVGWVDATGDGEWAVALRCAHVSSTGRITAYAGAGIVEGSDGPRELAETKMKFRPIVEAFG